jgi:hypothetical protein
MLTKRGPMLVVATRHDGPTPACLEKHVSGVPARLRQEPEGSSTRRLRRTPLHVGRDKEIIPDDPQPPY